MAESRILALPVDGRPVTRAQVQLTAQIADCELLCPDVEQLGFFREPADREQLCDWLWANAEAADGFILSLDMLVYGGLVPSRFIEDDTEALIERLQLLRQIRARYPHKPLYAFCATMRMSNNSENEEEKLYWSQYGELIWSWSYRSDRFDCLGEERDRELAEQARAHVPAEIRQDYLDTRARNFAVTENALRLVEEGVIDRLVLPQDDTAEFGFNIAERRCLQEQVEARNLGDRVLIYPGADEVIYTLLAHQLHKLGAVPPVKLALQPHHAAALESLVARYEDRPLLESIHCQVNAAGAELVTDPSGADAIIAVHARGEAQGDWAMQLPLPQPEPMDAQWLASLAQTTQPLALLDLAYANGADPELIEAMPVPLNNLLAYAGWNTASNSIGSLVAQLCLALARKRPAHNRHLLAIRLLDDYLFQAKIRQCLRKALPGDAPGPEQLLARLRELYLGAANNWLVTNGFDDVSLRDVYLPWQRSFEIGLQTELATAEREVTA